MSLLDLFKSKKARGDKRINEQEIAEKGADKERLRLAKNTKTSPEILYYLAVHDENKKIRCAVAHNTSTPVHACPFLAKDKDENVKEKLMNRLIKLLPNLTEGTHAHIYQYAVEALGTLALDEVLKIRKALSSALQDHAFAPPKVVSQLARDIEREVSEPILRYCTNLPDDDLMDILSAHPEGWVVQAIAGRTDVGEPITGAIIDLNDMPAGKTLLENKSAQISTKTYTNIVDKARNFPEWQKPLAVRHHLPKEIVKELAVFIDASLRKTLYAAQGFDKHEIKEITEIVARRLNYIDDQEEDNESIEQRVQALYKKGALDDTAIQDAMSLGDDEFVIMSLAVLLKTQKTHVKNILSMSAPKSVTALCWKAGLSMRTALLIQQKMAKIPHSELLFPKEGTDYPLSEKDLKWQVDFLNL